MIFYTKFASLERNTWTGPRQKGIEKRFVFKERALERRGEKREGKGEGTGSCVAGLLGAWRYKKKTLEGRKVGGTIEARTRQGLLALL